MNRPTLVPFPHSVLLSDIPGRLRQLADSIEAQPEEKRPRTVIAVFRYANDGIDARCYGDNPANSEIVGMLMQAAWQRGSGEMEP